LAFLTPGERDYLCFDLAGFLASPWKAPSHFFIFETVA